jgi:hypothetical protein
MSKVKMSKVKISKYKNIETRTSLNLLNNVETKNVEGKILKVQCRSKKTWKIDVLLFEIIEV